MSRSPSLTKDRPPREATDTSSSRESSPELVPSRRQSLESEFSETAAPQIIVRDPSPQQDQSTIHQGLAFRIVPTKHINIYEASVKPGDPVLLPGQEVPPAVPGSFSSNTRSAALELPLSSTSLTSGPPPSSATTSPHLSAMSTSSDKSAVQKGAKEIAKTVTKKVKQADDTSFITGRFRLSQYSATPNDGPPVLRGQGPYASAYRTSVSGIEGTPSTSGPEHFSSPAAPPIPPTQGTIMTGLKPKSVTRSSKSQPIQFQPHKTLRDRPSNTSPTQARSCSTYQTRALVSSQPSQPNTDSPQIESGPRASKAPSGPTDLSSTISGANHTSVSHSQPTNYYRRNYEYESRTPRSDRSRTSSIDPRNADVMMGPPPSESSTHHKKGKELGHRRPNQLPHPRGNDRLVTALIEDNRQNPPDHLLAEVFIRCWSGGRPEELWCDAKDLSEALQSSTSRIDGPAKVFTQRGAYRQCFLRITTEQEDRYNSMNLALASDRTIPISVEYWTSGAQPKPSADWRMPWHGSPTFSQSHAHVSSQSHYHPYRHVRSPSPQQQYHSQSQQHHSSHMPSQSSHLPYSYQHLDDGRHSSEVSRKRPPCNDQSSPDYVSTSLLRRMPFSIQASGHGIDDYEALAVSRTLASSHPRKRRLIEASFPITNGQGDSMDVRSDFKAPGFDPTPEEIHQVVSDMFDELMSIDTSFSNCVRLIESPVLLDTIKLYREVDVICKKYVGRTLPVPGTTSSHKISEVDIARGLGVEDPRRFLSECWEMLRLLDLYGERGERDENPKVLEMLKENYRPDFSNVQPIGLLRKLLKDLDAQWLREHPEGGGGEDTRPTSRMT